MLFEEKAMRLPTSIEDAKHLAKSLRFDLSATGTAVSHSRALEMVSHQFGFRDWNTLHAAIGNRRATFWNVGDRLSGHYLGQAFDGEIVSVQKVGDGWFRLAIDLDEPVDVVTFESFSSFRRRITATVGPNGSTMEKTSNGQPHLVVDS